MNELIKIEKSNVGGDLIDTVNARELHQFLEVGKDFSTWIKNRIQQYGFVDGVDFVSMEAAPQDGGVGNRGFKVEYYIAIDMAKELAMVERSDKGREVRQYFIECERRLKQQTTPAMLSPVESDLRAIAIIGQSMRMSDSGVLMMYHSYCKENAPKVAAVLPPYAIDAPTGKESEGSKSHAAIKDICQGIMSSVKANKALMKAGLLEQFERPSTSAPNGIKTYKSVTAKGLKYGLNVTSKENTRETQPHWYHETADELIEIIKANVV